MYDFHIDLLNELQTLEDATLLVKHYYNQNQVRLNIIDQIEKQRIHCRHNNFRKIICMLPEGGSTEPKHVAIKRTSSNEGYTCIKRVQ
jgi:hypothetical protein